MSSIFRCKYFSVSHENSSMKVGTDAFILGSWLELDGHCRHILDVGTGSGIIALMLAQRSSAQIDAIDIDGPSVEEATINFANSPWSDRLKAVHSSLEHFESENNTKYDLVVSNPPFFSRSLLPKSDRLRRAKHDVAFSMDDLITGAESLLTEEGRLAVILPADVAENFNGKAARTGFFTVRQLEVYPKPNRPMIRKVLVLLKQGGGAPETEILTVRDDEGNYSSEYKILTAEYHAEGYV